MDLKNIGKKLRETGQSALNQTKKTAEIANLNVKINKSQGDLNKAVMELGKKFYKSKSAKVPKEFAAEFEAVETVRAEIKEMRDKIAQLKNGDEVFETPADVEVVDTDTAEAPKEEAPKAEPKAKAEPKPKAKTTAAPKAKAETKPKAKTTATPKAKAAAKPKAKTTATPKAKAAAKPKAKTTAAPKANNVTIPKSETSTADTEASQTSVEGTLPKV